MKWGTKTLVVNYIIGQMKKLKIITPNKKSTDFVKKLEIIQLDLESYEKIEDMAIGEIETKLPEDVTKDLGGMGVKDTLEDSSSKLKYERWMQFLSKEKD